MFLFAVNNLSNLLQDLMGERSSKILKRFTDNILLAVLTGTIITVLLDSSSAVIIITIVLVNAKVIDFKNAIGIVMGANIGTTFSSQLIALDIGKYSPIPIFLGLLFGFYVKNQKISSVAKVMLYFGILFFGLYTMERAVEPLRESDRFTEMMLSLNSPLRGAAYGALVTVIIQSSSATMGMVITLAKKSLIELSGAIAVMIGAELGTCADTLFATIKSSRQALKTGLFHLSFNIISISIGLLIFPYFVNFILSISDSASLEQKVANAHMLFNFAGVILFLPFVKPIENLLNHLLPDPVVNK